MGESAVKATRRELRRAIGVSALQTLQLVEEGLQTLGLAVNEQRRAIKAMAEHQAERDRHVDDALVMLQTSVDAAWCHADQRVHDLQGRNWRGRLRWLVTGL